MRILFIILLTILSLKALAQDNIIQTDGTEIKARVLVVEVSIIKYKRFDNLEGPIYSILKSQVFMIQYENGTRDVFNKIASAPATNSIIAIKDSLKEENRIKSHIFINAGIRTGVFPTQYATIANIYRPTSIGFTVGLDIEAGNVYYFAPKKMPKNFGVGINFTWFNSGFVLGNPSGTNSLTSPIFFPYTSSLGPQISYQPTPKMVLDLYAKPGISLVYINSAFKPNFILDVGINFRYKHLLIGVNGAIIPVLTDRYAFDDGKNSYNLVNIAYHYSHIRIRLGVSIYKK